MDRRFLGCHLSDAAYSGLCEQAARQGFVRLTGERNRGVTAYLNALALVPSHRWTDRRPDWQTEADDDLVALGKHHDWSSPESSRWRRTLPLLNATVGRYIELAVAFDIFSNRRGDLAYKPISVMGMVLEAIGLGWLHCDHPPVHQYKRAAISRRKEWDWT